MINLKDSRNAANIVREVAASMGWRESTGREEDCQANVFWYERAISVGEVKLLNEMQRVNMIPVCCRRQASTFVCPFCALLSPILCASDAVCALFVAAGTSIRATVLATGRGPTARVPGIAAAAAGRWKSPQSRGSS